MEMENSNDISVRLGNQLPMTGAWNAQWVVNGGIIVGTVQTARTCLSWGKWTRMWGKACLKWKKIVVGEVKQMDGTGRG